MSDFFGEIIDGVKDLTADLSGKEQKPEMVEMQTALEELSKHVNNSTLARFENAYANVLNIASPEAQAKIKTVVGAIKADAVDGSVEKAAIGDYTSQIFAVLNHQAPLTFESKVMGLVQEYPFLRDIVGILQGLTEAKKANGEKIGFVDMLVGKASEVIAKMDGQTAQANTPSSPPPEQAAPPATPPATNAEAVALAGNVPPAASGEVVDPVAGEKMKQEIESETNLFALMGLNVPTEAAPDSEDYKRFEMMRALTLKDLNKRFEGQIKGQFMEISSENFTIKFDESNSAIFEVKKIEGSNQFNLVDKDGKAQVWDGSLANLPAALTLLDSRAALVSSATPTPAPAVS